MRPALHARGSAEAMGENLYATSHAVILSHAARLASLVECTPAHAQCVALIGKNLPADDWLRAKRRSSRRSARSAP
jgi:hypothetical protein